MLSILAVLILQIPAGTISVKPSATDPAIKEFDDPHLVYSSATARPRNELFVFLPGTGGKPGGTNAFCQTAADLGYDAVALAYPTAIPATIARNDKDQDAFENFRLEIIEGRDLSPHISVDRTNCIENRLIKLLEYMAKQEPQGRWKQYLDGRQNLVWSKIAVSGHSQGGGHAALIAVHHRVARAVMTGAPKDFDRVRNLPAAWYRKPATPVELIFTFNHELDKQGCDLAEELQICRKLGLEKVGPPVSVDKSDPPYRSRILTTNFAGSPTESAMAHSSVIGDRITPRDKSGRPVFLKVWKWMMTAG